MMLPDESPESDGIASIASLLGQDAELPLGLRARVEAKVVRSLRDDRGLSWEERVAVSALALTAMGTISIPGGLLVGPLIFVAWGVAGLYGALLNVDDAAEV